MKLQPVTKLKKKNIKTSKKKNKKKKKRQRHYFSKLWNHHHNFSYLWPIWNNLEAGFQMHMVSNFNTFINSHLLSYKNLKQNYKISSKTALILLLWVKGMLISCKTKGFLVLKGTFSKTTYVGALTYQIASF